nr:MAG TPA: hypothetical protein [Caudoviricetes sp.]
MGVPVVALLLTKPLISHGIYSSCWCLISEDCLCSRPTATCNRISRFCYLCDSYAAFA